MKCLFAKFNTKATVLLIMMLILSILTASILKLHEVYKKTINISLLQLKQDAHMLSIVAVYAKTLNQISWINKQLKRIALLTALGLASPKILFILKKINFLIKGLKLYQDYLLKTLPYKILYYDKKLSMQNKINLFPKGLKYIQYRRRFSLNLGLINIPGLIEFNKSIFKTACVKHKNVFNDSKACVLFQKYKNEEWFAPVDNAWVIGVKS